MAFEYKNSQCLYDKKYKEQYKYLLELTFFISMEIYDISFLT